MLSSTGKVLIAALCSSAACHALDRPPHAAGAREFMDLVHADSLDHFADTDPFTQLRAIVLWGILHPPFAGSGIKFGVPELHRSRKTGLSIDSSH